MTRITDAQGAASIRARLRNLGRSVYQNVPADTMLLLYAQQGFLGRLNASEYSERFVLKGALSLFARYGEAARPTEDLDLAARGLPNTPSALLEVMGAVCRISFGDGLRFDQDSV